MSTSLKALVTRKKIVAADVVVDPNTKNRYFTETLNVSELANISFATAATDSISVSESFDSDASYFKIDSLGISESINTHLTHQRQFSDSFSLSESLAKTANLAPRDTVAPEEVLGFNTSMIEADSFFMDELISNQLQPPQTDGTTVTDSYSAVRTYIRAFNHAVSMDDTTSVGSQVKDTTAGKNNVVSFAETQVFAIDKQLTESPTISEAIALLYSQPHSENLSISETFAPVFSFNQTHDETVSVSESAVIQPTVVAADSTSMGDTDPIFVIGGNYQETPTLLETLAFSSSKALTDTPTVTDSISTELTNVASSVFNATPLNLFTLNN